MINYMSNKKVIMINLTVGLIKKNCYIKIIYFQPYVYSKTKKIVELLDLPNYAAKYDLRNAAGNITFC